MSTTCTFISDLAREGQANLTRTLLTSASTARRIGSGNVGPARRALQQG
jgi:hypothetical protein